MAFPYNHLLLLYHLKLILFLKPSPKALTKASFAANLLAITIDIC